MNDDIKLLSMLYRYSQRRMVVSLGLVQAHFIGDAALTRTVVDRLEQRGLVYVDGVTVRLTLPGFARAVSASAPVASVHRLRKRPAAPRSRAA
jgi:hypothetical protein